MGEVYRARDTALNRDVAIKVVPELFAADPDRLARFTRDAQVLAALNHPNIAAIYGIEGTIGNMRPVSRLAERPFAAPSALPLMTARGILEEFVNGWRLVEAGASLILMTLDHFNPSTR